MKQINTKPLVMKNFSWTIENLDSAYDKVKELLSLVDDLKEGRNTEKEIKVEELMIGTIHCITVARNYFLERK